MTSTRVFVLLRQRSRPDKMDFARRLRQVMTRSEQALWRELRSPSIPCRVRRQTVIAGYIADFYCAELQLVIEVDGPTHLDRQAYDGRRDQAMQGLGLHVVRLTNEEVLRDPEGASRRALAEGVRWREEKIRLAKATRSDP